MPTTSFAGYQRSTPFLQRNLARSVESLAAMGNTASSNRPSIERDSVLDEEDRPAKRRRLETISGSNANYRSLGDELFQARHVGSVHRTLQVDVRQIIDGRAAKIRTGGLQIEDHPTETKARCKLTLSHISPAGDTILHCASQVCTLKAIDDQAAPCRKIRVRLPRAFHIPEDSIYVNREDDDRFHLGDAYRLSVELETTGEGSWPPLDPASLLPFSLLSLPSPHDLRRWVLAGEVHNLFGKHRSKVPLRLKTPSAPNGSNTKYIFDIDTKWATGYEASVFRPLEKDVEPSITVYGDTSLSPDITAWSPPSTVNGGSPSAARPACPDVRSPLKNITENGAAVNDMLNGDDDEDMDGEVTPNRSLRTRNSINYNLKDLSRKAQGKEAKNRKRKGLQEVEEGHIIYDVPAQTVQLTSFRCVSCGIAHRSLAVLQTHLKLQHPEYEFVTQLSGKGARIQVAHRYDYQGQDDGQLHLLSPAKPFRLEQLPNGDTSPIKLRALSESQADDKVRKPKRRSAGGANPSAAQPKPKPKTHLVPFTKQPLYDSITRLPLEPGSEFIRAETDSRWLVQWHREAIEDFSDIPSEEREYITTWDEFMLSQRINSEVYLQASWLEFVKQKADWLVASESRRVEFGKHFTYLMTRNVLDDATIWEAFQFVTAANNALKKAGTSRVSGILKQPKPKTAAGCQICGRQVLGPKTLVCSKLGCRAPSYHADCVGVEKRGAGKSRWKCKTCSGPA
ncbi:hypothetical protein F5X68DRAFT_263904 [Plectosphaerella plurivora]|uniref:Zinc finger PHD-type domain-containing protein n=1 Tax=Plectosphaerella plurivora TaxID=936078 RepID=A0A9P9A9N1_9PEZI|nr:hypothetical protein F5X68DRAFT_263904 [Plectosphaerella plurivora]